MIKKSNDINFDYVSHKKIDKTDLKYESLVNSIKEDYDLCLKQKNIRTYIKMSQYYCLHYVEKNEEVVGKTDELSLYLRYVEPGSADD